MRADTITRAQAQLPATREEMEQRLGGTCIKNHILPTCKSNRAQNWCSFPNQKLH